MTKGIGRNTELEVTESLLRSAFAKIRLELSSQRASLTTLESDHYLLKRNALQNDQCASDWINHFNSKIKRIEDSFVRLENEVSTQLSAVSARSGDVARQIKEFQAGFEDHLKQIKEELRQELSVFYADSKLKPEKQPIINVNNANNVTPSMPEPNYNGLTNPEKWLAGVLFNSENPLSYSQIAEKTGKTVSTVRVYMNQLKLKNFIDESSLPSGIKIFALRHKAKVNALYNL
jgi:hypothetical protein